MAGGWKVISSGVNSPDTAGDRGAGDECGRERRDETESHLNCERRSRTAKKTRRRRREKNFYDHISTLF